MRVVAPNVKINGAHAIWLNINAGLFRSGEPSSAGHRKPVPYPNSAIGADHKRGALYDAFASDHELAVVSAERHGQPTYDAAVEDSQPATGAVKEDAYIFRAFEISSEDAVSLRVLISIQRTNQGHGTT